MINAAVLATKLMDQRNGYRRLLGAGYSDEMVVARAILLGVAGERSLGLAEAALAIGKEMDAKGVDPMSIFCAFVEECEKG